MRKVHLTTPITSIRSIARRTAAVAVVALCAAAVLSTAQAQAQAPAITWTAASGSDTGHSITAVSCQAGSLCVAVDDHGGVLSSVGQPSASWTAASGIGTTNQLNAVACPSVTLCVAVDNNGNAYSTSTPTSTPWTLHHIDGSNHLTAVACPSFCVAVDNAGNVLTSADGATWNPATHIDGSALNGLSCPTASLCVAVDVNGHVLVSTDPANSASWPATPPRLTTTASLTSVSCNSAALCVAAAGDGSVFATANASAATPTWSWTQLDPPGPLNAVSCTDAGLCVAVDHAGTAFSSDNPAGGPPSWTVTPIDATNGMTAVSCVTAGFCVAGDDLGNTLLGTLPAPSVTTGAGTASSQTVASVTGTVNPGDAAISDCHFEFGPTTSYGTSAPCATVPVAAGGAQAVSASLTNLVAGTTYHFRVVAAGLSSSAGADATFTTAAPVKANPSLSGTPAVGQTLTCKPNVTVNPPLTIAYQWLSDMVAIAGATAPTYVVAVADQTHHLSCYVTIAGDGGSASANSGFDAIPSQTAGKITETFVGTDAHGANAASAPVTCSPQAAGNCTITLKLTAVRTVKHRSQTVAVGSTTATVAAGATKTLSVALNATGRQLLHAQHHLSVTLTVSGTVLGSLTATLQTDKLTFTTKAAAKRARAAHRRTHATRRPR